MKVITMPVLQRTSAICQHVLGGNQRDSQCRPVENHAISIPTAKQRYALYCWTCLARYVFSAVQQLQQDVRWAAEVTSDNSSVWECVSVCGGLWACVCGRVRARRAVCVGVWARTRVGLCVSLSHCVLYEYKYSPWTSLHSLLGYVLNDILIPRKYHTRASHSVNIWWTLINRLMESY